MSENASLVLLSGGLDSTTLLHHVAAMPEMNSVHALSYDYGQRHKRELDCAAWQARSVDAAHHVIAMDFLPSLLDGATTLVEGGDGVPDLGDIASNELDQPPTYVPNRNMILLSLAAAYAEAHGIRDIYYGAQAMDEYGYWDCTAEFVNRINETFSLNRRDAIRVYAPFLDKKKEELLAMGTKLGVDYSHTWSCYRGGDRACGVCPTCVERRNAFKALGQTDPIAYEE